MVEKYLSTKPKPGQKILIFTIIWQKIVFMANNVWLKNIRSTALGKQVQEGFSHAGIGVYLFALYSLLTYARKMLPIGISW